MSEGDLPGHNWIVVGHVREQVVESVLELDLHASPKLLDIERRRRPVDADLFANLPRLLGREARAFGHGASSVVYVHGVIPGLVKRPRPFGQWRWSSYGVKQSDDRRADLPGAPLGRVPRSRAQPSDHGVQADRRNPN